MINLYSLFTVLVGQFGNLKHARQFPTREVLLLKAKNIHATLRLENISVRGMFSYESSTKETANLVFVSLEDYLMVGNY